ncbi:hypothetical protein L226DRAFT_183779 [Lentinus tigrinus ALCF2SS1-7]|uniref:uncharacterized protein n=1 Tax=Lentinus tigrinus ALCF2SS1-7 TaxID=1328758 RepID=UPI001165EF5A|nr:hypothetical protein L226DRAFT_183779 [Lentinus tigrinus ALCF2SS1-7]
MFTARRRHSHRKGEVVDVRRQGLKRRRAMYCCSLRALVVSSGQKAVHVLHCAHMRPCAVSLLCPGRDMLPFADIRRHHIRLPLLIGGVWPVFGSLSAMWTIETMVPEVAGHGGGADHHQVLQSACSPSGCFDFSA